MLLPDNSLVLRAWAILENAAPGAADYKKHTDFAEKKPDAYITALNEYASAYTDEQLASMLLKNTGLDTIDLEGDGNFDNMAVAKAFLASNAGNRMGAILNLTGELLKHRNGVGAVADVAKAFFHKIDGGHTYSNNEVNTTAQDYGTARVLDLSTGKDVLKGSALSDYFKAYIQDNANTLQSGDSIDGGAGNDTLYADIGNSQKFAITPETKGVENVLMRAQAIGEDSKDNNLAGKEAKLDAQRMKDVLNWENIDSRADLVVEDVRINDNQITKDITITMRQTDQGHVDYGLYFDQNSLRNFTNANSQINLRVLDTYSTSKGEANLKDSPYGSFTFYAKDTGADDSTYTKVTLKSQEMQDAQTLEEMVKAIQAAADAALSPGAVNVSLGATYSTVDPVSKKTVQGQEIVIKAKGNYTFDTTRPGSGWLATETVPATSGLYTDYNTKVQTDTAPVTSKIVLDYVGRGSNGGDLVVGGLSVGHTSGSKGVQRFEVEVQDDSRLETMSSTHNTLREVSIVNGKTDRVVDAYSTLEKDAGLLRVNGKTPETTPATGATLPGGSNSLYGFQDVRLIDGSAMTGKLEFTAELTKETLDKYVKNRSKYLSLKDIQENPLTEDVDVAYSGGKNNDKIVADIDKTLTASNSNIKVGMADFNFAFNGNAGDDYISVAISRANVATTKEGAEHQNKDVLGFDTILAADADILKGNTEAWYANQRSNNMRVEGTYDANYANKEVDANFGRDKLNISGGEGNDDLRKPGAGDTTIDAGTGADVVYADNTGAQEFAIGTETIRAKAVYVFNTAGQAAVSDPSQDVSNLRSAALVEKASWGVKVQVNYRGITSKEIEIDDKTDFRATQLDINQAIKKAINDDPVLSKLLYAQDGPSGTLMVASKVDGTHVEGALDINFINPKAADITQEVINQFNAKNPTVTGVTTAAQLNTYLTNNVTGNVAGTLAKIGYHDTRLGQVGATKITGADSVTTSDNIIKPGTDMDADTIVLGTTTGANELASSNDIVKFEGTFGNDTIVNFQIGALATGGDRLDFRSYFRTAGDKATAALPTTYAHGSALATTGNVADEARIEVHKWDDQGNERNDSAEAVKALYTDRTWTASDTDPAVRNELYLAERYDDAGVSTGVAEVYHVKDGSAANDLTVTHLGSIDLASAASGAIDPSLWDNLTAANFV